MRAALRRHDDLIRGVVGSAGGYVFKTVGDAFCVAFADAGAAIAAAVEAQRALDAERWPEATPLRVRMALHSGSCEERGGDYFGPAVNRVARLLSLAHGGQTLVSEATAALVGHSLGGEVSFRELGEYALKDIGRRERIAQVVAAGLETDFPPLRASDDGSARHNLPGQMTSFVGRAHELSQLARLLGEDHIVTLVGPGGVGKTRLALEAAAGQVGYRADGVWFVELAPVVDEPSVGRAIAVVLGIREQADRPVVETVADVLGGFDALLILDNCEHLLDAVAAVVDVIARRCPRVTLMATSREPLAVDGEQAVRLLPLSVPAVEDLGTANLAQYDSVTLLLDRIKLHDRSFAVDEAGLECMARICRRLDGIPLALELAAARVRGLGVRELENRLRERFRLLTARGRGRLPRQQTLAATLDWSFDLLSARERLLFTRVSVFAGGFDLRAAEAVCAGGEIGERDVWELLTSLVDKSLVEVEGSARGTRYGLLETMREYGREHPAGDGDASAALARRHLEHYLAVAEAADLVFNRRSGREAGATLELESENFRAALRASLEQDLAEVGLRLVAALAGSWRSRGRYRETVEWITPLLEQLPDARQPLLRARALSALGGALMSLHRLTEAAACLDDALAIARDEGDDALTSRILGHRAFCSYLDGDSEAALALATEARATAERTGDCVLIAVALARQADAYDGAGDQAQSRALLEQSLELLRAADNEHQLTVILNNTAATAHYFGELDLARERLEECVALCEARDNKHILAGAKRGLAIVLLQQGQVDAAAPLAHEALLLAERMGSPLQISYSVLGQAFVASAVDNRIRAAFLHGVVDALFQEAGALPEPLETKLRDEDQQQLISRMGPRSFEREYERGRTTPREAALAFARQPARKTSGAATPSGSPA